MLPKSPSTAFHSSAAVASASKPT